MPNYSIEDLKKIKRCVSQVISSSESTPQKVCYNVSKPEDVAVQRRPDEGARPIFKRDDVVVNRYEHKDTAVTMNTSRGPTRSVLEVSEDEMDQANTSYRSVTAKSPMKHIFKGLEESFSDIQSQLKESKATKSDKYFKNYLSKIKGISEDLKVNLSGARKKRRRSSSSDSYVSSRSKYRGRRKGKKPKRQESSDSYDSEHDRSLSPVHSRSSHSDSDGRYRARKSYSRSKRDSRYGESSRKRRSYSTSYPREYYNDVMATEQEDIEVRYHRYNAAMCAISVILEIIMQNAM